MYLAGSDFVKLDTEYILYHCDLETTFTDLFPHHENPISLYNCSMTRMSYIIVILAPMK
jgi:hypothetical protein